MCNGKKWLTALLSMAMCLTLAVVDKQDVEAGRDYTIGSYIVCTEDTKLFVLPDCNEGVVAPIAKNSVAMVVENEKIYTKVNCDGVEGYLYQEFIGYDKELIEAYVAEMLARSEEVRMIAAMIQCEAGNQEFEGQLAVGAVIMNRIKSPSYPNTVIDVLNQPGQFGPAGSQRFLNILANNTIKDSCLEAAKQAYTGVDNTGGLLHFQRAGVREGLVIGSHVFY